jgi:glycosyltransferase involved in cell wall biosynthesis
VISLAYITRNEEAYLERSIRSVAEIVDEIIVVDAFSEDRTAEIAESLGATVYEEEWIDDFSHARNIAVSHCSEPWILMFDADEHFEGESIERLRRAADEGDREGIVAFQLPRKNHFPGHDPDSPFFGPPFWPDLQTRLFRRMDEIFFSGRVHEGVVQAIEASGVGGIGRVPVTIHHHLFRGDREKHEASKAQYYRRLAEMDACPEETE